MRKTLGIAFLFLAACASTPPGTSDDDTGDDDTGDDVATPPDAEPTDQTVRFIAMGDTGQANEDQYAVAAAIKQVCATEGCDFALLLGDNIYSDGPTSGTDTQFNDKFELPYADLDLTFHVVLGNHDYGGQIIIDAPGVGNEFEKGPYEVEYSQHSTKWSMPATHYTFTAGNVGFIMMDTNSILWSNTDHGDQTAWWPTALDAMAGKDWVFAIGHHPYRSNGTHGDAGSYEAPELGGITVPNPLPIVNGADMQAFYEAHVCGQVDVILNGHDHSRQWINEPTVCGGTEMLVSGAGAEHTDLPGTTNQTFYQDASKPGFLYIVIDGNTLTGRFYDSAGNLDFERTITHP